MGGLLRRGRRLKGFSASEKPIEKVLAYLSKHPCSTIRDISNGLRLSDGTVERYITFLISRGKIDTCYRLRQRAG